MLPYRNPVNLAAEVAALDVLSEGRFVLGVGAGWMQEEFRALGIDPAERGPRTDEHIEVLRTLWTQDPASFERPLHATSTASCWPPRRAPRAARRSGWAATRIAALRRALRLGDGWHGFEVYPEDMPDVHERLARIGEEVGRDPASWR